MKKLIVASIVTLGAQGTANAGTPEQNELLAYIAGPASRAVPMEPRTSDILTGTLGSLMAGGILNCITYDVSKVKVKTAGWAAAVGYRYNAAAHWDSITNNATNMAAALILKYSDGDAFCKTEHWGQLEPLLNMVYAN